MQSEKQKRQLHGCTINRILEENRRLNRLRNFWLWVSAYAAGLSSIALMWRGATIQGHQWEVIVALLLVGYLMLFISANDGASHRDTTDAE